MRLVTFRDGAGTSAGRADGDLVTRLPFADVGQLLTQLPDWQDSAPEMSGETMRYHGLSLAPVIPHPEKIICVGLNYRAHILEMKRDTPEFPTLFTKTARTLAGSGDELDFSPLVEKMDYEAELAVIIGSEVHRADASVAEASIAGFSIMNDVSARDWQSRTTQWWQGKNFERSTPLGPELVTVDESGPFDRLVIECVLDGQVVQRAECSDLVFGPADLVAYISQFTTLVPGDVIATGTPGGVAAGSPEPQWIKPGSKLTTRISNLGECTNEFTRRT